MTPDLVLKGGTVVDGSGRPPFEADVVVHDDRIVAVGRHEGPAGDVVDARGKIVTPGFVDVHTHLDAQLTWDPLGAPSCWHGVTSVVVGNCGVGFAPCRPADRDYLMFLMEGVEDVPRSAMSAGMRWEWESFGQYLDTLGRCGLGVNAGAYVAHAPLRVYAMGERGVLDVPPTDAELETMRLSVDEALAAGALGLSTGRTTMHRTPDGDSVPGTFADRRELAALIEPLARRGAGVFEAVPYGTAGEASHGFARDIEHFAWAARECGRPVSVLLTQSRQYPEGWRDSLRHVEAAVAGGARLHAQVAPRQIGLMLGMGGLLSPFFLFPEAGDLLGLDGDALVTALHDPAVRARLRLGIDPEAPLLGGLATFDRIMPLDGEGVSAYEGGRPRSVAGLAETRGVSVVDVIVDALLESNLRRLFMVSISSWDLETSRAMLDHPLTLPALGDSGAHTSQTCDVGVPTFMLAYWVQRQKALSLASTVRRLTFDPASLWGIPQRGLIQPGWFADLNVIDLDALDLELPEVRHDMPGGALNLSQRARGFTATVVNGRVTLRNGEHTGARPGRVLRNEHVAQ
ncbi:MAG TPA: amidohydrolase family protein [Candidatus Binatia bacterium]|jgi:N-acyl-D-aspartate/D-glutamate deacylase|nr:amidohydrolase family protein [Candidatus Binatia bacterium]